MKDIEMTKAAYNEISKGFPHDTGGNLMNAAATVFVGIQIALLGQRIEKLTAAVTKLNEEPDVKVVE